MMFRYTAQVALNADQVHTQYAFSTVCPDPVTIHQLSCHALPHCMPTDLLTVALNFSCLCTISILTQQCMMSHNWHVNCTHCRQQHLARPSLLVCIALALTAASCRRSAHVHVWCTAPVAKQYMCSSAGNV